MPCGYADYALNEKMFKQSWRGLDAGEKRSHSEHAGTNSRCKVKCFTSGQTAGIRGISGIPACSASGEHMFWRMFYLSVFWNVCSTYFTKAKVPHNPGGTHPKSLLGLKNTALQVIFSIRPHKWPPFDMPRWCASFEHEDLASQAPEVIGFIIPDGCSKRTWSIPTQTLLYRHKKCKMIPFSHSFDPCPWHLARLPLKTGSVGTSCHWISSVSSSSGSRENILSSQSTHPTILPGKLHQ